MCHQKLLHAGRKLIVSLFSLIAFSSSLAGAVNQLKKQDIWIFIAQITCF
jgi:hypothetical protein